jgi:glycosyltransferase involved in cell wall biosynthesis
MLIGIDASRSTVSRRTGTENYALHLIRELLALETPHRFRLYFNEPPPARLPFPGAERRVIPFPRLWTHVRLSWEMAVRPPDLLFEPAHVLPLVHPRRSVATVHDLGYLYYPEAHTAFQNAYLRWSTRYNARTAARVVADSEATRQDLIRHYAIPQHKIVVVYPGRDETLAPVTDPSILAAIRARYGLAEHYILYVGTLQPRKNLVRLVQAYGQFLEEWKGGRLEDWKSGGETLQPSGLPTFQSSPPQLVIAGKKGWLYDDLVSEIERLGLGPRVVLTGYVPDDDLAPLLSGALAFVFPSLYEGFGLPVIEAMACGTPVICSDAGSLPEAAGDAALLVGPHDTGGLAAAMARMADDAGLRRELSERGLRQARRFSWRECARQVLAVLEEAGRGVV